MSRVKKILLSVLGVIGAFGILLIGVGIGSAGSKGTPKVTVTVTAPGPPLALATPSSTHKASPSPSPRPSVAHVLVSYNGANQNYNSSPFKVGGPVTVTYSYNSCPNGQPGNFIADLITAGQSQSSLNYEDINVANQIGNGGNYSTKEYPQQSGASYYLSVQSECTYSISVTGQ